MVTYDPTQEFDTTRIQEHGGDTDIIDEINRFVMSDRVEDTYLEPDETFDEHMANSLGLYLGGNVARTALDHDRRQAFLRDSLDDRMRRVDPEEPDPELQTMIEEDRFAMTEARQKAMSKMAGAIDIMRQLKEAPEGSRLAKIREHLDPHDLDRDAVSNYYPDVHNYEDHDDYLAHMPEGRKDVGHVVKHFDEMIVEHAENPAEARGLMTSLGVEDHSTSSFDTMLKRELSRLKTQAPSKNGPSII